MAGPQDAFFSGNMHMKAARCIPDVFKSLSGQELSSAIEGREAELDKLHDMIGRSEAKIDALKDVFEPLRALSDTLEKDVSLLLRKVNRKVKLHNLLMNARKITPVTGMGALPLGMFLSFYVGPAASLCGLLLAAGSMALHQFSTQRCPVMSRECDRMKADYGKAADYLGTVKSQCSSMEEEIGMMEKDCQGLREKEKRATAEVKSMADKLAHTEPSGSTDVDEADGYLIIDGFKIRKQAA